MPTAVIVHNHPIHYKHLLFQELARQGLSFEVVFTAASSRHRRETPPLGPYPCRAGYNGPYESAPRWRTARYVWSSLTELAPRAVVISGYYDVAAWTAWAWGEAHRVPRVLWAESNYFDHHRRWWKERLKRLFVARCEAADVYGESSRDYLLRLGMRPDRITTKRAVVDTSLFSTHQPRPDQRPPCNLLLYVGRFSPEKNLDFLIRSFAALEQDAAHPRLLLALVGYGPLEDELRKLVSDLRRGETVRFLGPASQAELPALYRGADACILPSLHETWGLVVLEAMACGLPVLVSNRCGCARDLVTPQTGWTFDLADRSQLLAVLHAVAAAPRVQLDAMGECAARLARDYSPGNCARLVIATIETVLGKSPTPCPEAL